MLVLLFYVSTCEAAQWLIKQSRPDLRNLAISNTLPWLTNQQKFSIYQPTLRRSIRDSIGNNRMVNTIYDGNKTDLRSDENIPTRQEQAQQSALMNQYASFFTSKTSSANKAMTSAANLKKMIRRAYHRIRRERHAKMVRDMTISTSTSKAVRNKLQ